ncbi:YciI family protein [Tardiphaga alba]|uniref:YciI family protein n=1 Tax=Tardiphaga alba TaxID=340268 RepID=A0ABX8A8F5_9BRAD|nr:YciI family protein [Tardiphaga alba]QUS38665.1 YciI family protein [Tardiphaga alba]
MLFAIHAVDRPGSLDKRLSNYDAHKAFLSDTSRFDIAIVISGPLVADDGQTMIGSLFLVEAAGRAAVEAFHRADPFFAAGIWEKVTITGFLRRQG